MEYDILPSRQVPRNGTWLFLATLHMHLMPTGAVIVQMHVRTAACTLTSACHQCHAMMRASQEHVPDGCAKQGSGSSCAQMDGDHW